jgi:DNA polymerase I-like protein with 3'-5' exonuclease and polymerase domains
MGPKKLYDKLNSEGFAISFDAAKDLYYKYCKEFATGVNYLRNNGKIALREGYLANENGRRRYWLKPNAEDTAKFPLGVLDGKYKGICGGIEREGGNFLIQSVNADITKLAMVCMRDHIKKHKVRSNIMMQVYDEVVTCTHKNDSEEWVHVKNEIMIKSAETWLTTVPVEVDGHVLPYWTK